MIIHSSFEKDIFLKNKYTRWYQAIINNAKLRWENKPIEYSENHHIVPKSLGGTDSIENLVWLTAREHFICHRLLIKMLAGKDKTKMQFALLLMLNPTKQANKRNTSFYNLHNGREYETIRKELALACSEALKQRWADGLMWTTGHDGIQRGRTWSEEQKARMRAFQLKKWAEMSLEEKNNRAKVNKENGSNAYNNLTSKQRELHRQKSSDGSRSFWNKVTPEQLNEMNAKNMATKRANKTDLNAIQKAAYHNQTPEAKLARAEKIRAAKKIYWADPENRKKQQERQAEVWKQRKLSLLKD